MATSRVPGLVLRALVAGLPLVGAGLAGPSSAHAQTATAADRPPIKPLPANLEAIRAQEATALYGSPEIRPIEQRKTALITMGDSEISGEGVGNYVPGTHQDGNWCDRSYDQAVFRTGIAVRRAVQHRLLRRRAGAPDRRLRPEPAERAQPGRQPGHQGAQHARSS